MVHVLSFFFVLFHYKQRGKCEKKKERERERERENSLLKIFLGSKYEKKSVWQKSEESQVRVSAMHYGTDHLAFSHLTQSRGLAHFARSVLLDKWMIWIEW